MPKRAMGDHVVCLHCGGALGSSSEAGAGSFPCRCQDTAPEAKSVRCPGCGGSISIGARACPYCGSTVATCRCAACLAWNIAGAAHCQACGRSLDAKAKGLGTSGAYPCPRCKVRLQARAYADLGVEECDTCGGLFLTPQILDRIVAAHDTAAAIRLALPKRELKRETTVRYIHCPVCAKMMNRQAFGRISGVVVDVCKAHGVWFDGGELAEVIRFVEQGGLERLRARELEELAERERRVRAREIDTESARFIDMEAGAAALNWSSGSGHADLVQFIADLWKE